MRSSTFMAGASLVMGFGVPALRHLISFLLRHNLVIDIFVGRSRQDLLLHQLTFPGERTPFDDLLGGGISDPWQGFKLVRRCGVEIKQFCLVGSDRQRRANQDRRHEAPAAEPTQRKDNETESFHDKPSCDELNFPLGRGSKCLESNGTAVS